RLHDDLISAIEKHQRMVLRVVLCRSIRIDRRLRQHGLRIRSISECPGPSEDIRESIPCHIDLDAAKLARRYRNVDIARVSRDAFDRSTPAPELAGDNPRF